jgi:hypothetical protein
MVPVGVIRPILLGLASASVNQRLPSGPNVMSFRLTGNRRAARCRQGEFRYAPGRGDAADIVAAALREPEIPVGAQRDATRKTGGRLDWELSDTPGRRDAADIVSVKFRKPKDFHRAQARWRRARSWPSARGIQ